MPKQTLPEEPDGALSEDPVPPPMDTSGTSGSIQQELDDTKRSRGRPSLTEEMQNDLRQQVRQQLWTPNLVPVGGVGGLPDVYLPTPPGNKGTSKYKAWAQECFLELLRHGYNYSQAAEKLGYNYRWWINLANKDPKWASEAKEIRDNPQPQDEYPDLTRMSFPDFVKRYFGFDLAEHQKEISDGLCQPKSKLVLILGFPESGKSTLVSLWYLLYRLAQNPDIRIALVSKSTVKAQDLLTRVKRYLTEDQLYDGMPGNLIEDFNGWKPVHGDLEWSQSQIFVRHRKSGERDPTIQALGIGKQIYGSRLDLLILDDALVLDNQISETQKERIDNWFTNEARSRAQKGQTVVNGTRLWPLDLYSQWKKSWQDHPLFKGIYIPAILDEHTETERVTWPEYWSLDGYDLTQEIEGENVVVGYHPGMRDIRLEMSSRDASRWRMVYQQEDVEEVENVFRQEHINRAFELGSHRSMGRVFDHEILILGVDPAPQGRAASILIALDPTSRVRTIVDIFVGHKLGATGIRNELLYRFWDAYASDNKIRYTVIETNFAPTLLGDHTLSARAEAAGTVLVNHQTVARGHQRGSKWDEEYGIGALAPLFSGGLIAFPSATPEDRSKIQPLIDDMLVFPWADQQDALVALWVANGEANVPRHDRFDLRKVHRSRGIPPVVSRRTRG